MILEVKQYPELETRIGQSDVNAVCGSLLQRCGEIWMCVDIEDAPHFVESKVGVPFSLCVPLSDFFQLDRALHDSFRNAAFVIDADDDWTSAELVTKASKVIRLGRVAFADDQDAVATFHSRIASPEHITSAGTLHESRR